MYAYRPVQAGRVAHTTRSLRPLNPGLSVEHKERPAKIKFCSSTGTPCRPTVERFHLSEFFLFHELLGKNDDFLDQDDQILKNEYSETGMISFTFANLDCFVLQVYLDNWYTQKNNLKMMLSERNLLFQGSMFRLHVNLQGFSRKLT